MGRQEAIPFLFQTCCVNNHVTPGGAPVEVLSQAANDSQSCGNDWGSNRKHDPQDFHRLYELGGGDGRNKRYQSAENNRPCTVALIRVFVIPARLPVVIDLILVLFQNILFINFFQSLFINHDNTSLYLYSCLCTPEFESIIALFSKKHIDNFPNHPDVVKSVRRLFDELVKCDEEGVLKDVRKVIEV